MDTLLGVLRTSTNNEERKRATAELRQIQESDPRAFLTFTWERVSSSVADAAERFFVASTTLEFVENSWSSSVSRDMQEDMIDRYLQLVLREVFPSLTLARKFAVILGVMLRKCSLRGERGTLPRPLERTVNMLAESTVHSVSNLSSSSMGSASQLLLTLHMILKEMEKKRVGGIFHTLCRSLVPTMSNMLATSASWDYSTFYTPLLYLLKCALRVFGAGSFEVGFYPYLLEITWRLARVVSATGQPLEYIRKGQRLMEYAVKIQLKMVKVFVSEMSSLPLTFFVCESDDGVDDTSLFSLLVAIMESPIDIVVTEKLVCRAMNVFADLLMAEDSNSFVAECITSLANSQVLLKRIVGRIFHFLADQTDSESLRNWDLDPERCAAELVRVTDDTEHVTPCAEELILLLTGSSICAQRSLHLTWEMANSLLVDGSVEQVTAALHVIGTCCYTMSAELDPAIYMDFLTGKLLPIMVTAAGGGAVDDVYHASSSPFVVRRVIWVVGMWCESVQSLAARCEVHGVLASLLGPSTHVVLQLVALRSIGNFMEDPHFRVEEVPPERVNSILVAIQRLLSQLHSPATVEHLVGLVNGMIMQRLLHVGSGELLLNMILPAVYRAVGAAQGAIVGEEADCECDDEDGDDIDNGRLHAHSLDMLLECVSSCVSIAAPELEERIWTLFTQVVVPCTQPYGPLRMWVEESAWELLLSMCNAANLWLQTTHDALMFCLENMTREIAARHIVVRCVYVLLLLCPEPEKHTCPALVDHAMKELTETENGAIADAYFALLAVILQRGNSTLRSYMVSAFLESFLNVDSVQSETFTTQLSVLLAWSLLPCKITDNCQAASLDAIAHGLSRHPNASSFVEGVVLLFDVSPSKLVTDLLVCLLQQVLSAEHALLHQLIGTSDRAMAQKAIEGVLTPPVGFQQGLGEGDAGEASRDPTEMLLELLGDGQLGANSPHAARLRDVFGACIVS